MSDKGGFDGKTPSGGFEGTGNEVEFDDKTPPVGFEDKLAWDWETRDALVAVIPVLA